MVVVLLLGRFVKKSSTCLRGSTCFLVFLSSLLTFPSPSSPSVLLPSFLLSLSPPSLQFYKALITHVHKTPPSFDLLYNDGAAEQRVARHFVRKIIREEDRGEAAEEEIFASTRGLPLVIAKAGKVGGEGEKGRGNAKAAPLPVQAPAEEDGGAGAAGAGLPPVSLTKGPKKALVRHIRTGKETTTSTSLLKSTLWLGSLPSEAAKGQHHKELHKWLVEEEGKVQKKVRNKFKAVQRVTAMVSGDKSKYEGMV